MSRQNLIELAQSLLGLHKSLMDASVQEYESVHGPVGGPLKLYQLLTEDAHFAWLRPLSGLMAQIDEAVDDKENPPTADTERQYRELVGGLLGGEVSPEFAPQLEQRRSLSSVAEAEARVRQNISGSISA